MEVKNKWSQFDISKICRACLTEKEVMQSVFIPDESIGQTLHLAEMIMNFTNVQIQTGDGLPSLICLDCVHQVTRAFSFKQLCEQSDTNLRQFIEKPAAIKEEVKEEEIEVSNYSVFVECVTMDDSSDNYHDDKDGFPKTFILPEDPLDPANENLVTQTRLKEAKLINNKLRKKVLTKSEKVMLNKTKKIANQCHVCKKQFFNLYSFKNHLTSHIEGFPFKCKVCPRSFKNKYHCNSHMITHIPDEQKPHKCEVCKKRFTQQSSLNKHMLKHSAKKSVVCKICNKACYTEAALLKHMKIHEKKEGDPDLLKHICDYCKTEFPDSVTLDVHIKQHTGDRPFLCNVCGKSYSHRYSLEVHLRSHTGEKPFPCEICQNNYVSKASLRGHMRTHTGEKPFTCEICQNKYVSKTTLKIHMRTHTNERPFPCEVCGKAFRQKGDLTSHKSIHGTEKPIECNICEKRFLSVRKLKYHMRNHTGEHSLC